MTDNLTKEQRKKNMKAIRSESMLEGAVTSELWRSGYRFRRNVKSLKEKPDIAIKKYKIAIFIDSCFWHACPIHGNLPKSNTDYWINKLNRNKKRDLEVSQFYQNSGWNLLRIWEHELKEDFFATTKKIERFIEESKVQSKKDSGTK